MSLWLCLVAAALALVGTLAASPDCAQRTYEEDGIVCVCNATYCDEPGLIVLPPVGQFALYSSSKDGLRLHYSVHAFTSVPKDGSVPLAKSGSRSVPIHVDTSVTYQEVIGFGGAMTDAAAINMAALSPATRENLLRAYFSSEGLQYTLMRVPMAGTDFSTHTYSYDDTENDVSLEHFDLTVEDYEYKIPYIKRALELNKRPVRLFTAPWSAPKWMKTNNEFYGQGKLKAEYYQLWAEYFVKFFERYAAAGLEFWGVSAQNEPTNGAEPGCTFNCMGWTAVEQRDWVAQHLGPSLSAADLGALRVLVIDDQRTMLDRWPAVILSDPEAKQFISGVAVHWYTDQFTEASMLDDVHDMFPDVFLLYTEACNGVQQFGQPAVVLGSWERGEAYATSIIQTMNHWVSGWVDWNLALDPEGGPNWSKNFVDSPVIVNASGDEFLKQPAFYVLGHFSKFVPEGSSKVALEAGEGVQGTAFLTPEGSTVVVLLNTMDEAVNVVVTDAARGESQLDIPARSIHTLVYQ